MNAKLAPFFIPQNRRTLLKSLLSATGGVLTSAIYAEALTLTPRMTEGPYYPDHLPLDQDNDLTLITGGKGPAGGVITEFGGRVLDADGKPAAGQKVELWQADVHGCYIHSRGTQRGKERDASFQGYGKIMTNEKGEYRFRTIKPGLYTGRTIHWHVAVTKGDKRLLTTQLFIAGVEQNDRDGVLRGVRDEAQRLSVIREFKAATPTSQELVGTWDIVLGATPDEREMGKPTGKGKGKSRGPRNSREPTESEVKAALLGR